MESHHILANKLLLHLMKICNSIPLEKHLLSTSFVPLRTRYTPKSSKLDPKLCLASFSAHYHELKFQEYSKKIEKESIAFTHLLNDLSLICSRLVRDNLIVKTWLKTKTSILREFNPHVYYYYHMDVQDIKLKILEN